MVISNTSSQIKKIVDELLEKINNDDFVLIPRPKNITFMRTYRLNQAGIKELLKCISIENYVSEEFDTQTSQYGTETVVIFIYNHELTDFHGNSENVKIYVKIKRKENHVPVISIHESDR